MLWVEWIRELLLWLQRTILLSDVSLATSTSTTMKSSNLSQKSKTLTTTKFSAESSYIIYKNLERESLLVSMTCLALFTNNSQWKETLSGSLDLTKERRMKEDLGTCLKMLSICHQLTFLIRQIQNKCIYLIYKWTSRYQRKCRKRWENMRRRNESMTENLRNTMSDKARDTTADKASLQMHLKQFLNKNESNIRKSQTLLLCQK